MATTGPAGVASIPTRDDTGLGSGTRPLVSVVIPTRNRAPLLPKALDSVLEQEGLGEQFDVEIVVVDDASEDSTPDVVRRYPMVRYVRLESNRGLAGARNAGIKASRGAYIAFLDDDDVWLPHKLRTQVPVFQAHPDVGVVYGQNIVRHEGVDRSWPDAAKAPSGRVFHAFLKAEFISMNTPVVRRDAFDKAGYFDESLATYEHHDMFLRLAFHFPFKFLPGNVAINHVNMNSLFWTMLRGSTAYEETVQRIIRRGLDMIRDPIERAHLEQDAEINVFLRVLGHLQRIDAVDRMRAHILAAFRGRPWMLRSPVVRAAVARSVRWIALAAEAPLAAVRSFCLDLGAATPGRGVRQWIENRRLSADVWTEAAIALGTRAGARAGVAARAALYAVLCDPVKIKQKALGRIVLSWVRASWPGRKFS